ncbi:MAG: hypothetical protein ACFE7R_02180, partial [Candidatus Hodarchaeota archaeon]
MTRQRIKLLSLFSIFLMLFSLTIPVLYTSKSETSVSDTRGSFVDYTISEMPRNPIPIRRAAFVESNPDSYKDEFAYMAAIPTAVFMHEGNQSISPLIYATGSDSENWLVEDWADYLEPDGGITQAIGIGSLSSSVANSIQEVIGLPLYPRITGTSSAQIAAELALMDWDSSEIAIFALAKDNFEDLNTVSGSASFTFQNSQIAAHTSNPTISYTEIENLNFTPPPDAGWLEGSLDWSGSELMTHVLLDPDGVPVDYSVYSQVFFERNTNYVTTRVPLHFWYPNTKSGDWTMMVERLSPGSTSANFEVKYHPGFTQTVNVPANAKWLNATITWDNSGTDLNLALIDPDGNLVAWAPSGSILSGLASETVEVPYPMSGTWKILMSWMDPSNEQNNVELTWDISSLPANLESYFESAANGAVLASLMNAPLLYVSQNSVPEVTRWAAEKLGVNVSFLVDPLNIHSQSVEDTLGNFSFVSSLESYPAVSSWIHALSGETDVVVTAPQGNGQEFFAPAALSAAFHGAPVFSLCGAHNSMTTTIESTWVPYLVGPEIEIYITSRWTTRTENGWYDERIPNRYSMMESVDDFEDFLTQRGAYNSTSSQSVVIVSPADLIKLSLDRSLQSHFQSGRIPAENPASASIMINRANLHRFLYSMADSAEDALLTMYAYTDGAAYTDNFWESHTIRQIEDSTSALTSAGFTVSSHVGASEVFSFVASQVGLWSMSTHGTLSDGPRDPPDRPGGLGLFSLRDIDAPYGFEDSIDNRESA